MPLDPTANFVRGLTTAQITNSATTLSVADATIFPDPSTEGEYNIVVWAVNSYPRPDQDPNVEIMRVTAVDTGTNELTVSRGQEDTVAAAHPSGSAVQVSATAKMFSDIESELGAGLQAGEDFDGQGTSEFSNLQSLSTADLNNAKQASQHSSPQAAIDAAGVDGTVVFDAAGAPYAPSSEWSFYDGQTVVLRGDVATDSVATVFDFSGLTDVTLAPNGRTIDGLDRETGAGVGVLFGDGATRCSVDGTLRLTRLSGIGVDFDDANECSAGVIIGIDIGSISNNNAAGDVCLFGLAQDCVVNTVVGRGTSRHTATFADNAPERCKFGTVISVNPGGAHLAHETAIECDVGTVVGTGARQATTFSNPGSTYATYGEITYSSTDSVGVQRCHINKALTADPVGGSGPAFAYGNSCNENTISHAITINSAGTGVTFSTGAGSADENTIEKIHVDGAAGVGVRSAGVNNTVEDGVIKNCQNEGWRARGANNIVGDVTFKNNCQSGTSTLSDPGTAIKLSNNAEPLTVRDAVFVDDQSTTTQEWAVWQSNNGEPVVIENPDVSANPSNYSVAETDLWVNGTQEISAAPSDSSYGPNDAGKNVVDYSNGNLYVVNQAGNLEGPF